MHDTSKQYDAVVNHCRELFSKKMKDYGSAWRILRLPSLTDQIFIKAQRIRSLQENAERRPSPSHFSLPFPSSSICFLFVSSYSFPLLSFPFLSLPHLLLLSLSSLLSIFSSSHRFLPASSLDPFSFSVYIFFFPLSILSLSSEARKRLTNRGEKQISFSCSLELRKKNR